MNIIITGHPCPRCGQTVAGDRAGRPIAHTADECIANLQHRIAATHGRLAELAEIKAAYSLAADETCPTGEHHCACVPLLRSEIARLCAAIEDFDAKLETETSFEDTDGQSYVAFYRVPAGPWHKILAMIRGAS